MGVLLLTSTRSRFTGQGVACRDFVLAAIDQLLDGERPAVTTPSTDGRFNLLDQPSEKRVVTHLIYAPKSLHGANQSEGVNKSLKVIKDLIPLRNGQVAVQVPHQIHSARLVPESVVIPFTQKGGMVSLVVPEFTAHATIELA